jgi:membrane protease subunit HflK
VLSEYQKAPQVTRDRMYVDAMQQIYGNVTKVLVDSRSGSNLLYLPLDKILQQSQAGGEAVAPAPAPAGTTVPPASSTSDSRSRDATRSRERETR